MFEVTSDDTIPIKIPVPCLMRYKYYDGPGNFIVLMTSQTEGVCISGDVFGSHRDWNLRNFELYCGEVRITNQ